MEWVPFWCSVNSEETHLNKSKSQIPQSISRISHNAPFFNRNVNISVKKMVHCGIWNWCIVGFVHQVYYDIGIQVGPPELQYPPHTGAYLWYKVVGINNMSGPNIIHTYTELHTTVHTAGHTWPTPLSWGHQEQTLLHGKFYKWIRDSRYLQQKFPHSGDMILYSETFRWLRARLW